MLLVRYDVILLLYAGYDCLVEIEVRTTRRSKIVTGHDARPSAREREIFGLPKPSCTFSYVDTPVPVFQVLLPRRVDLVSGFDVQRDSSVSDANNVCFLSIVPTYEDHKPQRRC